MRFFNTKACLTATLGWFSKHAGGKTYTKHKKQLPLNVFSEKVEIGRFYYRCKRSFFSTIFISSWIKPRGRLGVNHQQVISVHDGVCTGFLVGAWCSFLISVRSVFIGPSQPDFPPLLSSSLTRWWIRLARLIPAFWSSSLDHQPPLR